MTEAIIQSTVIDMTMISIGACVRTLAYWFARTLQLQLFLMLFSLPILAAWGIPVSCMSPLGNCLFSPFLVIFLLLASMIFFAQLIHIPYGPVALLLNYVTDVWMYCMQRGTTSWLIGITQLPMPCLIAIGIAPLCVIAYRPTRSLAWSNISFLTLLLSIYAYTHSITPHTQITTITCTKGQLTLIITPLTTTLIDPGYLASVPSAASWVRYTLIPELVRTTGTTRIHHLIMLQPRGFGFQAAEQLCTCLRIDRVYIPCWTGIGKPSFLKRYTTFKTAAIRMGTGLVRTNAQEKKILISESDTITIVPQAKRICKAGIVFQSQVAEMQIDNKKVTIYPAK